MTYENGSWHRRRLELRGHIADIDGSSWDDIWIVGMVTQTIGRRPFLMHFDGKRLQEHTFREGRRLWGVAVRSKQEAYAVGDRGLILRWDGQTWRRVASGWEVNLFAVEVAKATKTFYIGGMRGSLARIEMR